MNLLYYNEVRFLNVEQRNISSFRNQHSLHDKDAKPCDSYTGKVLYMNILLHLNSGGLQQSQHFNKSLFAYYLASSRC